MKPFLESNKGLVQLIKKIRSGVIHIEYWIDAERINSGSAFMSEEHLITCNHLLEGLQKAQVVKLSYQPDKSISSLKEISCSGVKFRSYLINGDPENRADYAIFDVPELRDLKLYNFEIESSENTEIGEKALILGFPLEHKNLVCNEVGISSFYQSQGINIIQFTGSVNVSNSGGPLVDMGSGKVIGIVTRKATGLIEHLFEQLLKAFDQNVKFYQSLNEKGKVLTFGFNPIDGLIVEQNQLKELAKQIYRSANVGIGYAFSAEYVLHSLNHTLLNLENSTNPRNEERRCD